MSTSHHPHKYGHTERVNQVIKDVLRMYVMDQPTKWENYLYPVEFAYSNGYHSSLKVSPFEAMYGRQCNTPISWDNLKYKVIIGTKLLKKMEDQIVRIKHNLKTTHDR